jgi:hypothetical protein
MLRFIFLACGQRYHHVTLLADTNNTFAGEFGVTTPSPEEADMTS